MWSNVKDRKAKGKQIGGKPKEDVAEIWRRSHWMVPKKPVNGRRWENTNRKDPNRSDTKPDGLIRKKQI